MKFTTKVNSSEFWGTSFQDYISAGYNTLCEVFGEPTDGDGYKTDAQWVIKFRNGTVARIYNYKNGKNYLGRSGTPKTKITQWHVGGKKYKAVELVQRAIAEYYSKANS